MYNFENGAYIPEIVLLEGKFNTILADAESRFKIYMAERKCQNLKVIAGFLVTLIGAILAKAFFR